MSRPECRQPLAGLSGKFNLISTLSALSVRVCRSQAAWKALTLQTAPFIRPALAAGAIPPPLFFERRRDVGLSAPKMAFSREHPEITPASITRLNGLGASPTTSLPPKDS
jgi:hypothetical protein